MDIQCKENDLVGGILRKNGFTMNIWQIKDESWWTLRLAIAFAVGCGLRIGFSSGNESFILGYSDGVKEILFDYYDEFDKWSRCMGISKKHQMKKSR